jgi:hypothetical protein
MTYPQGMLRACLLALIVALSYATPATVRADTPSAYCPWVETDPGEKDCHCHSTEEPQLCQGEVWECTESGWDGLGGALIACSFCDDYVEIECSN